jgi:hypothetical protein
VCVWMWMHSLGDEATCMCVLVCVCVCVCVCVRASACARSLARCREKTGQHFYNAVDVKGKRRRADRPN